MNDDLVADLKQFISGEMRHYTDDLRAEISRVELKIDDLSAAVAEALDTSNEYQEVRVGKLEQRLTRLEQKTGIA